MRNKNSRPFFSISANELKILTKTGRVIQKEKNISGRIFVSLGSMKKQSPWACICPGATVGVNRSGETYGKTPDLNDFFKCRY